MYLPVELATRELDSRVLLGCVAAARGYRVVLGRKRDLANAYGFLPRGLIVDKSLAAVRREQFARLRRRGYRLAASEEESIWAYREPEQFLKMRLTLSTIGMADYYFAWGDRQAEVVSEVYPEAERVLRVTGTPRFDILRPRFHGLYASEARRIRERIGPYILLPSSFAMVLDHRGGRDFYERMRVRHGGTSSADDAEAVGSLLDHTERNLGAFVEAIDAVRAAFPDRVLVIRPHPGDAIGFWHDVAKGRAGVEVIYEGSVMPWLMGADALFHHGCSTGLEARFLGRTAVAYHPFWDSAYDNHLSTRLGPVTEDLEALIEGLRTAVRYSADEVAPLTWLDRYIHMPAERLSADLIVDAADELDLPLERPDRLLRRGQRVAAATLQVARTHQRGLRRRLRGLPWNRPHEPSTWDEISAERIEHRIAELAACDGRFEGVCVGTVRDHIYTLEM